MKPILNFQAFKESFKPKRLAGREEEGEKIGIINWIKKAKVGEMKDFDWFDSEPGDVVFDDIDERDTRICVLMAEITHKNIIKYKDLQKGDYMLASIYKQKGDVQKPWILTIEDIYGPLNVSKERFQTFEDAHVKMTEYTGVSPEVQRY